MADFLFDFLSKIWYNFIKNNWKVGNIMKPKYTLKNWAVATSDENPFLAPELRTSHLLGSNGTRQLRTSAIVKICPFEDHLEVETLNSIYVIMKEDVRPDYERMFPNAYERLKERSEKDV